jgi:hypothetical protein
MVLDADRKGLNLRNFDVNHNTKSLLEPVASVNDLHKTLCNNRLGRENLCGKSQ